MAFWEVRGGNIGPDNKFQLGLAMELKGNSNQIRGWHALSHNRREGIPLTAYFSLGTMGMGAWSDSRVVRTSSASDFQKK